MILCMESDAVYLVLPNAKSQTAGYLYFSENTRYGNYITQPERNGPLHFVCKTLKHVVASAAEAETGFVHQGPGDHTVMIHLTSVRT